MGTTTNLALNRPAASSSYVMPYAAANAVNGTLVPISRWLCNTLPGWMSVDLGAPYWINRWVVRHMGVAGWPTPDYNMSDFKLQASVDNKTWQDLDSVAKNQISLTDRTLVNAFNCRYVRVYVTKGLNCNPQLASIMEFEVYPAPSSPYLTGITLSSGTLSPAPFSRTTFAYTASVTYDVSSITLTPTAEDVHATIKVNGTVVKNNTASQQIPLNVGANTITVEVTGSDGVTKQTYTVTVTRAGSQYLSALTLSNGTLSPTPFAGRTTFAYTSTVSADVASITVTPTAEYANSKITVNGTAVTSGTVSGAINLNQGANTINVVATDPITGTQQAYTVTVTRASSANLTNVVVMNGRSTVTISPTFDKNTTNYTGSVGSAVSSVSVKPTAEDAAAVIKVNGTVVQNNTASAPITLNTGKNDINVSVTSNVGGVVKNYIISITR